MLLSLWLLGVLLGLTLSRVILLFSFFLGIGLSLLGLLGILFGLSLREVLGLFFVGFVFAWGGVFVLVVF